MDILIFGDSLAWGAWDKEGGWAERIHRDANAITVNTSFNKYLAVYNLSICGDTSGDVLERFDRELVERVGKQSEKAIIYAVGINDSYFYNKEQKNKTDPSQFELNIHSMIDKGRKYTKRMAFIGLTPVVQSMVDPVSWSPEGSYRNEDIRLFDRVIEKVCLETGVTYIPIFETFSKSDLTELTEDGAHLNTKGHKIMYEVTKPVLLKMFNAV